MPNVIYYDTLTLKVLSHDEAREYSQRGFKGSLSMIDQRYVKIEDGFIVKKYTRQEVEAMEQAKRDAEDAKFFEHINQKSRERAQENPETRECHYERTSEVRIQSVSKTKSSISRSKKEKKTIGYNLKVIISNVAKEHAKKNSAMPYGQSFKRSRSNKKTIKQTVAIGMVVAILTTTTALGYGLSELNRLGEYRSSHASVSNSTATLLDSTPEKYSPNIVSQNTTHNHFTQTYWYDNEAIGKDVLSLPDESFDANLYLVYAIMGDNAENAYNNNFDDVIKYIGTHAKEDIHPNAYLRCNGCDSLEEFLVKNGIVDEKGMPSIDLYKKHGRTATITHKEFLEKKAEAYKAEYAESLNKGGR